MNDKNTELQLEGIREAILRSRRRRHFEQGVYIVLLLCVAAAALIGAL